MKAIITRSSDSFYKTDPPGEMNFETLEQLREWILSVDEKVIVSVSKQTPDELYIEVYDDFRE